MPWDEENTDYDEPKSGSGDSHEDEFDDEYGEQQPHGDPNRPDNALEDAHQADIDYWEAMARLNAIARPFDPDATVTSDASTYNPFARSYDPDATVTSDASTYNPFADALEDSSKVSLSSQLSSPDPDDFDRAESVDHVGPPIPDSAVAEPDVANALSFDPEGPFADPFGEGSVSPSSQLISSDLFDPGESYQAPIVDPGPPVLDSAAGEPDAASGVSFDPSVPFADSFGDSSGASLSSQLSSAEAGDSYVAGSPSFAADAEFSANIPEQTDWNDVIS